jgi:hypothetical protein
MTKEKLLNQEIIVDQEPSGIIYRAYLPFFRDNVSSLKTDDEGRKYRVVEGAIIVDRRSIQEQMGWTDEDVSDHFTTLWEVDGFLTDVRKINFDFRHNGISTGAIGERSWKVDDYEIQIDDKILKVPARMLAVRVYEDNQIRIKGKNGETIEDGSLLTNIENGRVFTWSVEFKPVRQMTTRSGLTLFKTYHTPRISFLDVTQGIPDAGGFTLRSYLEDNLINNQTNQPNMSLEQLQQALANGEITQEHLRSLLETEETKTPETDSATPESQRSESKIEIKVGEPTGEGTDTAPKEGEGEETPPAPAEADQNGDGELSDSEVRSYIKELKRSYDSPAMISEKLGELERSFGEINERMNSMVTAGQTKTETDKSEAEMQRQYETTLSDIPNEAESQVSGDMKRQLDPAEKPKVESKRFTLEDMQAAELKAKLYHK